MEDLRQFPRLPLAIDIGVEDADGNLTEGRSRDLSMGGMFLETHLALAFGEEITITLDLPGIGPSSIPAVVRWLDAGGVGVHFGLLGARQTAALSELVRSLGGPPSSRSVRHRRLRA